MNNYETFEEWFKLIKQNKGVAPRCCIPYDEWLEQYIDNIGERPEEEVKELLRNLLFPFTTKLDQSNYDLYCWIKDPEKASKLDSGMKSSLEDLLHIEKYKRLENNQNAWEGLTWIVQLLPYYPYKAIRALRLYSEAEVCYMPDNRIIGIEQCIKIIEAKYIYSTNGLEKAILGLKPREFEWLIELLYKDMGYETELTPATRDGGKDIIAYIKREDGNEKVYVECKLYKTTELKRSTVDAFGFKIYKDNINRGVIFCTGYVNDNLKKVDSRIQIWTLEEIIVLLNAHIGADWDKRLHRLIEYQRRKYEE